MHFLAGGIQNHGPKLAFTHFSQTFQQNALCLKLIRGNAPVLKLNFLQIKFQM